MSKPNNPIKFFNTLTRREEDFAEVTGKKPGDTVLMYNCGPTVYSNAHIGNLSAYIMADLIRRFLEYKGYKVIQAKNITDVGHLVSDSDTGEDKMEVSARKEKKSPLEIARFYEGLYLADERKLHLREPEFRPRATETIEEMITIITDLVKKGFAYETSDGVYFDLEKYPDYGKLSGNTLESIRAGARIDIDENKKNSADFALWKKLVGENKNHILKWPSPWGEGFPGWHIECSAMAEKHLGKIIDIHTGGEDNIFPHHECEIAQTRCKTGEKLFSHFWMHKRHIQVEGEKMSKSKGNFYTLQDLEDKGINPLDFRLLILMAHYRSRTNFTFNGLNSAKEFRLKFINTMLVLQMMNFDEILDKERDNQELEYIVNTEIKIDEALSADLNTPEMIAEMNKLFDHLDKVTKSGLSKTSAKRYQELLKQLDEILAVLPESFDIAEKVTEMLEKRKEARINKDFKASDEIRDEISREGYVVLDTAKGQVLNLKD